MHNLELVLASSSPRRRQLLQNAGLDFRIVVPQVDEKTRPGESPRDYATRLAAEKARAVQVSDAEIVLAADTIVVWNDTIVGKPRDRDQAASILQKLSGCVHEVITAFCLKSKGKETTRAVATKVHFKDLQSGEIESYLKRDEALDKAGGYAVQGGAAHMVKRIEGSYTNVVGLPLSEVLEVLEAEFGFRRE